MKTNLLLVSAVVLLFLATNVNADEQTPLALDRFDRQNSTDLGHLEIPSTLFWNKENNGATSEIFNQQLKISKSEGNFGGIDTSGFNLDQDQIAVELDITPSDSHMDNFVIWTGENEAYYSGSVGFDAAGYIVVSYGNPVQSQQLVQYSPGMKYAITILINLQDQTQGITINNINYGTYPLRTPITRIDRIRLRFSNNYVPYQFMLIDNFKMYIPSGETLHTDLAITSEDILFSSDNPLKGTPVTITAFFHNILDVDPNEVLVRFYNGTPSSATFIGEQIVAIGKSSDFISQIDWIPSSEGTFNITVWIDPENAIPEEHEDNNQAAKALQVITKPDMRIRDQDVYFSNNNPQQGDNVTVYAMVRNIESLPTGSFTVRFYESNWNNLIGNYVLSLNPQETKIAQTTWHAVAGNHTIHAYVDSTYGVDELREDNNHGQKSIIARRNPGSSPLFIKTEIKQFVVGS
jgi:hypothetical protein